MEFRFLFKRKRVSSGQRLLVELRRARNTFIVRRQVALKLSAAFSFCVARHEIEQSSISPVCTRAFVREKLPQETVISYNPEKPPGGRFFCCRSIIPVSKRQRSASLAVRRGNSEAYSRYAPPKGTAKRLPAIHHPREQRSAFPPRTPKGNSAVPFPLPFPHTHKKAREIFPRFFCVRLHARMQLFPQKRGIDESPCFL